MNRLLMIDNCTICPFFDDGFCEYGKEYKPLHDASIIPDWCKLPPLKQDLVLNNDS